MAEPCPPAGAGSAARPWPIRVVARMTLGLRAIIAVVVIGFGAAFLLTRSVAIVVALAALLIVALIAQRAERQRQRLTETLGSALHERAERDQLGASEREELAARLEFWTTHDLLTHLPNRESFTRNVAEAVAAPRPFAVMTVTLTDFAPVVSTYGATIADKVLRTIAERLGHALRGDDTAGKLSAESFGVLLRGLTAADAQSAGDRLVAVLSGPIVVDEVSITIHARAGLAVREPGEHVDALVLLDRAEVAAAAAAVTGVVHLYAPALLVTAAERNRLEADLRRSIDADEVICYYQPLLSATEGRIVSFEALARWQHPDRGMVAPDQFIPAAEQSGLIVPLGLTVLTNACRQLGVWNRAGGGHLTMAVNLSARQLVEPGFVDAVRDIVWRAALDPRLIVLEITESLLVEDSDAAVATLWQLRGLGLKLAVDDFGTGYSSLSRLSDMPIDELKIDKSFVDRIDAPTADSAPIISAIVAMGHALGMTVVAEGVETQAQASFLTEVGCDLLQGYLLGRPLDAAVITPVLAQAMFDSQNPFAAPSSPTEQPPPAVPRVAPSAERLVSDRVMAR
jgi:diguanylate cyclase (GGDEF)-like protein